MTNGEPFYENVTVTEKDGTTYTIKVQLSQLQAVIAALRTQGSSYSLGGFFDTMGNPTTGPTGGGGQQGPTGQQGDQGGGSQAPGGGGGGGGGGTKRPGPEVAVTQSQAALAVFALGAVGALGTSHHRRKRRK